MHQGRLRVPGGGSEANMDERERGLKGRRGWGPSEPAQQSTGPPWANADVIHLLSTLMARLRMGIPQINTFSGDATPGKTKVSFEQ